MTKDEVEARILEATQGRGGPLSRACFDDRIEDCGMYGCNGQGHYVTPAQLRRIMRIDR